MMKCRACDSVVANDARSCWNCAAEFVEDSNLPAPPEPSATSLNRPHGGPLMVGGWALIGLSILLLMLGTSAGSSARSVSAAGQSWLMIVLAGASFQIGLLLAIAGIIVRAIWFLPGNDSKAPSSP